MSFQTGDTPQFRKSAIMFVITLISVYLVYGFQWTSGNPLTDAEIAKQSLQFSVALMSILLFHEMGHYWVAKYHGFELSVPYFLPFPFAFGTLGAVIHLRSLPKSRTALLEMGAAGPIAGFVVTILCILLDAPNTDNASVIEMVGDRSQVEAELALMVEQSSGILDVVLSWLSPVAPLTIDSMPLLIMQDPLIMKMVHTLFLDGPLSPYAHLGPIAFAGWVGCLITSINLLPIGQLDGGHIMNALAPKHAGRISKVVLIMVAIIGLIGWKGWLFWAGLLWFMGATEPIAIPSFTDLSRRAKMIAGLAAVIFLLSVMSKPIYSESVPLNDIVWKSPEG